jgi:branched-chain amino acid transport system substrate-binding protein
MAKYGKTMQAALTAEQEIINKERKKQKLPEIKIIFEDDQLNPAVGVSSLQKLITINKAKVVIGALSSSVTLAMAPVAEQNKVVLISPASTSPKLTEAGDYIFRTCPSDYYEAGIMTKSYLDNYPDKSIGIIYINNEYGAGLKNAFINAIDDKSVVTEMAYEQGAVDFKTQLLNIQTKKIKVIYLIGYNEMVNVFKQAKEMGISCSWMATNQLNDQSLVNQMGNSADETVFPGWEFDLQKIKAENKEFYDRYLQLSDNLELDIFAAYATDALLVINDILMKGYTEGSQIKDELYKIKNFKGLTGTFSFDANGDAIRELKLYQVKEGKITDYTK